MTSPTQSSLRRTQDPPIRMPAPGSSRRTRAALGRQLLDILDLASDTAILHYCCAGCSWLPSRPAPAPANASYPQRKKKPEVAAASCWWNEVEPTNDLGKCDRSSRSVLNKRSKRLGTSPKSSSLSPSALMEQKAMFLSRVRETQAPPLLWCFRPIKEVKGVQVTHLLRTRGESGALCSRHI